jgi:hypothetical protein
MTARTGLSFALSFGITVRAIEHGQPGVETNAHEPFGLDDVDISPGRKQFSFATERACSERQY